MKAYDDKGESGWSNEISITLKLATKLPTEKIIRQGSGRGNGWWS